MFSVPGAPNVFILSHCRFCLLLFGLRILLLIPVSHWFSNLEIFFPLWLPPIKIPSNKIATIPRKQCSQTWKDLGTECTNLFSICLPHDSLSFIMKNDEKCTILIPRSCLQLTNMTLFFMCIISCCSKGLVTSGLTHHMFLWKVKFYCLIFSSPPSIFL